MPKNEDPLLNKKASNYEEMCPVIHILPNEILVYIFSFLDLGQRIQIELVCRRWNWIGKCLPWTEPRKLVFDDRKFKESSLTRKQRLNDKTLSAILQRCGPCLRHLTLVKQTSRKIISQYNMSISEESLKAIAKYCPNLEEIKLKNFILRGKYLKRLAEGCSKLKIVHLSNCAYSGQSFLSFYQHCKVLESLTLEEPYDQSRKAVQPTLSDGFEEINPNLKILNLSNCYKLNAGALQNLVRRCDGLRELRLGAAFPNLLQAALGLLLDVLSHFRSSLKVFHFDVESLGFDWCQALSSLPELEELYLNVVAVSCQCVRHQNGACFDEISQNLRIVDLYGILGLDMFNDYVTDFFLRKIFTRCSRLEKLHFNVGSVRFHPSILFKNRDTLKELNLGHFPGKQWKWCDMFSGLCNLEKLRVNLAEEITDEVVDTLANKCLSLRTLSVSRSAITDVGLGLLSSLPHLTIVTANCCKGIQGQGIEALAARGLLEELHVKMCNITDEHCFPLARLCPNFRLLDVRSFNNDDSSKITNKLVKVFCESIRRGFLKNHVELVVDGTAVTKNASMCERLSLIFGEYQTACDIIGGIYNFFDYTK